MIETGLRRTIDWTPVRERCPIVDPTNKLDEETILARMRPELAGLPFEPVLFSVKGQKYATAGRYFADTRSHWYSLQGMIPEGQVIAWAEVPEGPQETD